MSIKPLSQCETLNEFHDTLHQMWNDPAYAEDKDTIQYWRTNEDIVDISGGLVTENQFGRKLQSYVLIGLRYTPEFRSQEFSWMANQLGVHL